MRAIGQLQQKFTTAGAIEELHQEEDPQHVGEYNQVEEPQQVEELQQLEEPQQIDWLPQQYSES